MLNAFVFIITASSHFSSSLSLSSDLFKVLGFVCPYLMDLTIYACHKKGTQFLSLLFSFGHKCVSIKMACSVTKQTDPWDKQMRQAWDAEAHFARWMLYNLPTNFSTIFLPCVTFEFISYEMKSPTEKKSGMSFYLCKIKESITTTSCH